MSTRAEGCLLLQAWAPPSHPRLAADWLDEIIRGLIGAAQPLLLLGHRPGRWRALPPQALPDDTRALLAALTEAPGEPALHRLPQAQALDAIPLLRAGDLHVRLPQQDPATGLSRIASVHLGRVLVWSTPAVAPPIVQQVPARAPLRLSLANLKNPWAGLRQPDAHWLRALLSRQDDTLVIGWLGQSLRLLGGPEALDDMHARLAAWLAAA